MRVSNARAARELGWQAVERQCARPIELRSKPCSYPTLAKAQFLGYNCVMMVYIEEVILFWVRNQRSSTGNTLI